MKANHKHYTLILFSIITLLVTSIGYFVLYRMIMFESDKSEKASIIIATDDQRKLLEQELEKIHQSSKEERAYVSGLIIDKDEIVTFIEEIEEIGIDTETDISISTIDSNDTSIKKDGDSC